VHGSFGKTDGFDVEDGVEGNDDPGNGNIIVVRRTEDDDGSIRDSISGIAVNGEIDAAAEMEKDNLAFNRKGMDGGHRTGEGSKDKIDIHRDSFYLRQHSTENKKVKWISKSFARKSGSIERGSGKSMTKSIGRKLQKS